MDLRCRNAGRLCAARPSADSARSRGRRRRSGFGGDEPGAPAHQRERDQVAPFEHRLAQEQRQRSQCTLEVWTTEPVLQVYTAGQLGTGGSADIGKRGVVHGPRSGLCLESQQFPNAPNCPGFPFNRVTAERPYRAQTRYRFGVLNR